MTIVASLVLYYVVVMGVGSWVARDGATTNLEGYLRRRSERWSTRSIAFSWALLYRLPEGSARRTRQRQAPSVVNSNYASRLRPSNAVSTISGCGDSIPSPQSKRTSQAALRHTTQDDAACAIRVCRVSRAPGPQERHLASSPYVRMCRFHCAHHAGATIANGSPGSCPSSRAQSIRPALPRRGHGPRTPSTAQNT